MQRWDLPEDMGNKEKATYVCDACGESFNYEQAQQFLEHAVTAGASEHSSLVPRIRRDKSRSPAACSRASLLFAGFVR